MISASLKNSCKSSWQFNPTMCVEHRKVTNIRIIRVKPWWKCGLSRHFVSTSHGLYSHLYFHIFFWCKNPLVNRAEFSCRTAKKDQYYHLLSLLKQSQLIYHPPLIEKVIMLHSQTNCITNYSFNIFELIQGFLILLRVYNNWFSLMVQMSPRSRSTQKLN